MQIWLSLLCTSMPIFPVIACVAADPSYPGTDTVHDDAEKTVTEYGTDFDHVTDVHAASLQPEGLRR